VNIHGVQYISYRWLCDVIDAVQYLVAAVSAIISATLRTVTTAVPFGHVEFGTVDTDDIALLQSN
jgi:hypothetical protein